MRKLGMNIKPGDIGRYYAEITNEWEESRREAMAKQLIAEELRKAESKHPEWPADLVHQAAIMAEESGETVQAALDATYRGDAKEKIIKEAAQTGAMAVRIIKHLLKAEEETAKYTKARK